METLPFGHPSIVSRVFRDKRVLRESYLPPTLPGRESQIEEFEALLSPLYYNEPVPHILFIGKTGTGKTAVVKQILARKEAEFKNSFIRFEYINCSRANTAYRVFYKLNRIFGILVPPSGLPFDVLYDRFYEALSQSKIRLVVILDEIDIPSRRGDRLLYSLSRINSELDEETTSLTIVGIANTVNFLDRLDERARSSFNPAVIYFPPYNADELHAILLQRARLGLRDETWEEGAINYIAAKIARESGDARRAIDVLRMAAEIAEKENSLRLTIEHAKKAMDAVSEQELGLAIRSLPLHHRFVLLAIAKLLASGDERPGTGKIYRSYLTITRMHMAEPLTMRRVSGIINELASQGLIETKMSYGGAYGNTKVVTSIIVAPERALKLLGSISLR
ncbi:MAG TPA: AAA family ATPase [Candidatus Korarchaeota archaeon]|nr:AAA family ATPase [Candidatus Korarchaeota archaeon]